MTGLEEDHRRGRPNRQGEAPRPSSNLLLLLFLILTSASAFADKFPVQDIRRHTQEQHDNADNSHITASRPYQPFYEVRGIGREISHEDEFNQEPNNKDDENLEKGQPFYREEGGYSDQSNSPNLIRSKRMGDNQIQPPYCPFPASCALRRKTLGFDLGSLRYPCNCDDQCHMYGDCCHDVPKTKASLHSLPVECLYLQPRRHYMRERTVFMVTQCPKNTPTVLAAKCAKTSEYTYLMDVAVVSATTDIVYANIFCARCYRDVLMKKYSFNISCSEGLLNSTTELASMTYQPGKLSWTTRSAASEFSHHDQNTGSQKHTTCELNVIYEESVGRTCELDLVEECSVGWPQDETRRNCSSYNFYVTHEDKQYKNWDCAVCNYHPVEEIECLPKFKFMLRVNIPPPPSLSDLFVVDGDCEDDQVWDPLYRRCEHVSCGFLFTLEDGECVRNNRTEDKGGRSNLNSTCYTTEFRRNYSVMFSNKSIYLNHTELLYEFGEYEFVNHSWVRVCRPETQWTPVMGILSTVLISISLVCMLLHILIFFALPRRRNIPSMNLFSMTCSLFIAELLFVSLFHFNGSYPACVTIGVIIYYFLSASFLWMNVMSIDICRTFHSNRYRIKSNKIFVQYSLYAWTIPLVSTIIALLVDQFASETFILTPQFGTHKCWFNNKWGLVVFFTFPSGFVVLVNMLLYGISVYDIYRQHRSGEFASSTVRKSGASEQKKNEKEREKFLRNSTDPKGNPPKDKSSDESDCSRYADRIKERIQRRIQAHKKQRVRLVLYCKLALMMGMTWIFAFVSIHTQSLVFEYLFIIFNGLQGTFIFIAFDCKQKQWEELKQRFTGETALQTAGVSSSTKQTSMTASSEGRYKYRWSSNRRQDRSTMYSESQEKT